MKPSIRIPFNRPRIVGRELEYIKEAVESLHLSGDGPYTKKCHTWLEERVGSRRALLTPSCTAGLEMAAILLDIVAGDEVIMPSYTFVSTANAFVLRGAVPVFVDVRGDTFNLDENLIEAAITRRTRAIVAVHYAGVGVEMDAVAAVAARHGLPVIEDSAQGLMSSYHGRPLGSLGALAAVSFHETKNVISGEGGALLINDPTYVERAEIIREKGTNRSQFFRGQVDKYTWVDIGSSYLPSETVGAFLYAQLEHADEVTGQRLAIWGRYHEAFAGAEAAGLIRRPIVPASCRHNAHMYYLVLPSLERRTAFIQALAADGIGTVFHYVPLHSSPAGKKYGRVVGGMDHTVAAGERIVRLPMWAGLTDDEVGTVIQSVEKALRL